MNEMHREKTGIPLWRAGLLCLGCTALGAALALFWQGKPLQPASPAPAEVMQSAAEQPADPTVVPADAVLTTADFSVSPARAAYTDGAMRLVIPKLGINEPVLAGTEPSTLRRGLGLYDYAGLPDAPEANVSIAGHRNGVYNGSITDDVPFYYINTLTENDYLYLEYNGQAYQYLWESAQVITPDNWTVIAGQGYGCVTLTTCTPIGVADHRLVVRGRWQETLPLNENADYPPKVQ